MELCDIMLDLIKKFKRTQILFLPLDGALASSK